MDVRPGPGQERRQEALGGLPPDGLRGLSSPPYRVASDVAPLSHERQEKRTPRRDRVFEADVPLGYLPSASSQHGDSGLRLPLRDADRELPASAYEGRPPTLS